MGPSAGTALDWEQLSETFGTGASPGAVMGFETTSEVHRDLLFNGSDVVPRRCGAATEPVINQLGNLSQQLAGRQPHDFVWGFAR